MRRAILALLGLLLAAGAAAQVPAATVPAGTTPTALAINPVTNKTYVANQGAGTVTVIHNATHATRTVTVGAGPWALAVNPRNNRIYVANGGSGDVSVIDGASDTVVATVSAGAGVHGLAVNPVTNRVYATSSGEGIVTAIDGASHAASHIVVGASPAGVAVNAVSNRIYVANTGSNTVTVIDGATGAITATIPAGLAPTGVAVNPVTNRAYVTNFASDDVTVIDGATNATTTLPAGDGPSAIAMHPTLDRFYVANQNDSTVSAYAGTAFERTTAVIGTRPVAIAIDARANRIYVASRDSANVTILDIASAVVGFVAVGASPRSIAVNPVTSRAYVANAAGGSVTVIDGALRATSTFPTQLANTAIAVDAVVSNRVYVASENGKVTVLNGATGETLALVNAGTMPHAIAHNPRTNKVYVANRDSGDVTVIDGATFATATVPTGAQPQALAVNLVTNRIYVANFASDTVTAIDGETNAATTIAVPGGPRTVAINHDTNTIYVGAVPSVTAIDGVSHAATTIPVNGYPKALAVNHVTNKVYTTGGMFLTAIDGATHATSEVATGSGPETIAVNEATNRIYVANNGSSDLTVIDGATHATVTLPVGVGPFPIAIDAMANRIYVGTSAANALTVIDGVTNAFTAMPIGNNPVALAINPVTNRLYVMHAVSNFVTKIDTMGFSGAHAPNLAGSGLTSRTSHAFSVPVAANIAPNDPAVRSLYFRLGDAQGAHAPAIGSGPFVVDVHGLRAGLNFVSLFAMDALEGTSHSTAGGGQGGTGTFTGGPRVHAVLRVPPYITTGTLPAATVQVAYSATLGAKNPFPSPTFTYSIAQGALPPGLGLDFATGTISGVPAAAGTYAFVVAVTDDFTGTGSRAFSITVSPYSGPTAVLSVAKTGTGTGRVLSQPAGIDCGATCSASFAAGAVVALAAPADAGSEFAGWSGGGCGATPFCQVTLSSATGVTATFHSLAPANPPRLGNLSTRGQVLTGNDVMIGGFVIGGSASKTVVVRARGPSLVPFGIANALANPQLQLVRSSDQATIATNDDWGSATNAAAITASGFAPGNALEAAILVSLPPGAYTAIVSGVGGGTGVGIVEVFEVDQPATPLVNISTRGQVLTGNDVMIGGFVIQGSGPQTVVIRARGPSLVPFGIANALANPTLQLVRSSDQSTVAANDNWGDASNAAAIMASGFAPSNDLESAILVTLAPGAYTAIVSGVSGGTGVGIVEVFAR